MNPFQRSQSFFEHVCSGSNQFRSSKYCQKLKNLFRAISPERNILPTVSRFKQVEEITLPISSIAIPILIVFYRINAPAIGVTLIIRVYRKCVRFCFTEKDLLHIHTWRLNFVINIILYIITNTN